MTDDRGYFPCHFLWDTEGSDADVLTYRKNLVFLTYIIVYFLTICLKIVVTLQPIHV